MHPVGGTSAFVGRAAEMKRLAGALDRARSGAPTFVLVGGEAGAGKTRLIQEWQGLPSAQGPWTVVGACVDGAGETLPFGPVRDAIRSLLRTARDHINQDAAAAAAGLFVQAAPPGELSRFGQDALQQAVFEGILDFLGACTQTRPVVMVLEDIHWADQSSLACLSFLTTHFTSERLLVVATYRTDEMHRTHRLRPWIADQIRRATVEFVELPRLTRAETFEMVGSILDAPVSDDLRSRVYERSEGIAFFVEALAGAAVADSNGRLPTSLREVLRAQLLPLSDDTRTVLRVAAVGGRTIVPDILTAILENSSVDLYDALREAADHHILYIDASTNSFSFRHALLQEIVLGDVVPGERERLHAAHADQLERRLPATGDTSASLALIAHHWHLARNAAKALEYSHRAAEAAMGVGAFADAQEQYERVLSLWGAVAEAAVLVGVDHIELLRRSSLSAYFAGNDERAISLAGVALNEVSESAEPLRAALLHEMLGWFYFDLGTRRQSFDAFERALALVPPDPPTEVRARILANSARMWFLWAHDEKAVALATEALEIARTTGSREAEVLALDPLGSALCNLGDYEKGIELLERGRQLAREVGDFDEEARTHINLGEMLFRKGDIQGAVRIWLEGYDRAHRAGLGRQVGSFLLCNVAQGLFESGDWTGAERVLEQTRSLVKPGLSETFWRNERGRLDVGRGSFSEARDNLSRAAALADGTRMPEMFAYVYTGLAELAIWEGEPADAYVERGLADVIDNDEVVWAGHLLMLGLRSEADRLEARIDVTPAVRRETVDRARRLIDSATTADWDPMEPPRLRTAGAAAITCKAELARIEGRIDRGLWAEAAAAWTACIRPYHAAYARYREAEACAHLDDRPGAETALRTAHKTATTLGAQPLLHEIRMLAQRARIDLAPMPDVERDKPSPAAELGLTERETEVLRQLSLGRSNREIATALFISPKTASVHVSNIMRKLGAPSRLAAATAAHRLGLVEPD
jgi:DNA-binding CsgD family transcriptional regulator/tetratricopeptide (TPR) repeat protein